MFFLSIPEQKLDNFQRKVGLLEIETDNLQTSEMLYLDTSGLKRMSLMGRLEVWPETAHNSQTAEQLVLWVRLCVRPRRQTDSP